jgi:hypothetical protein
MTMDQNRNAEQIGVGTVIRTQKWGPEFTGTVVDRKGDTMGIAWHNSFVESELQVGEVEVWPDAPEHLRQWRGGVGVWNPGHPEQEWSIEPVQGSEPGL